MMKQLLTFSLHQLLLGECQRERRLGKGSHPNLSFHEKKILRIFPSKNFSFHENFRVTPLSAQIIHICGVCRQTPQFDLYFVIVFMHLCLYRCLLSVLSSFPYLLLKWQQQQKGWMKRCCGVNHKHPSAESGICLWCLSQGRRQNLFLPWVNFWIREHLAHLGSVHLVPPASFSLPTLQVAIFTIIPKIHLQRTYFRNKKKWKG